MYLPYILLASEKFLYVQIKVGLLACTVRHMKRMCYKGPSHLLLDSGKSL